MAPFISEDRFSGEVEDFTGRDGSFLTTRRRCLQPALRPFELARSAVTNLAGLSI